MDSIRRPSGAPSLGAFERRLAPWAALFGLWAWLSGVAAAQDSGGHHNLGQPTPAVGPDTGRGVDVGEQDVIGLGDPSGDEAALPFERRYAVLLLASPATGSEVADGLTEVLIGEFARLGLGTLVGKEELQASLGQDDQASRECFASPECLTRLGGVADVDQLIAGTVGRREGGWVLTLLRMDVRSGSIAQRVARHVSGDLSALMTATEASAEAVLAPEEAELRLRVSGPYSAPPELRIDGADHGPIGGARTLHLLPGRHRLEILSSDVEPWERTLDLEPGVVYAVEAEMSAATAPAVPLFPAAPHSPPSLRVAPSGFTLEELWWTVGGIGAGASLLAGAALGLASQRDLDASLSRLEAIEQLDHQAELAVAANVLLAFGTAAALVTVAGGGVFAVSGGDDTQ